MDAKTPAFDPTPGDERMAGSVALEAPVLRQDWETTTEAPRRKAGAALVAPVKIAFEVELSPAVMTDGYAPRMIDPLILNTTVQRVTLKLLTATLVARGETLHDGVPVKRSEDAVRRLLEQLAVQMPSPLLDQLLAGAV